jgi:hypothetical protein
LSQELLSKEGIVYQHPVLAKALMTDRVAELRHSAGPTARVPGEKRRHKLVAAARHGIGWRLVDLGLTLATPRGQTSRTVVRGQR